MNSEEYRERLIECPEHNSESFINYLRKNNEVIAENSDWLLIENCKHNTKESRHYTAFLKANTKYEYLGVNLIFPNEWSSLFRLYQQYAFGWEIKIKKLSNQSINRFHVHFIE